MECATVFTAEHPQVDDDGKKHSEGHEEHSGKEIQLTAKRRKKIFQCLKVSYIVVSILVIICSVLLIGVSAVGAIVFRTYDHRQGSHVGIMIVLALISAVGVALASYGISTAIKNNRRPQHWLSLSLIVLACFVLAIVMLEVNMSPLDEQGVISGLTESFQLARQHSMRHVKLWHQMEFQLDCCGLEGPDDYRRSTGGFPPDVPGSCCAEYDPSLSDLVQRSMLVECMRQRSYYRAGCKAPVMGALKDSSALVYVSGVVLVSMFLLLGAFGIPLSKLMPKKDKKEEEADASPPTTQLA